MHENSGLQAYSEGCLLLGKLGYCMASSASWKGKKGTAESFALTVVAGER